MTNNLACENQCNSLFAHVLPDMIHNVRNLLTQTNKPIRKTVPGTRRNSFIHVFWISIEKYHFLIL